MNNNKTIASKSFEYKAKLIGSIWYDNNILDAEVEKLLFPENIWVSFGDSWFAID